MTNKKHKLDMKNTIKFYENHNFNLPEIPDKTQSKNLEAHLQLLPGPARERSILTNVHYHGPTWFHIDSTKDRPLETLKREEAISKTAICPSKILYDGLKTNNASAEIFIFDVPNEAASNKAKKVIKTEGLIHELAHTIIAPTIYQEGLNLKLPNGEVVGGFEYIIQFANIAEEHTPISHYSAFYRDDKGNFREGDLVGISEELAESIAAYQLGFAYCGDQERSPLTLLQIDQKQKSISRIF